MRTSIASRRVVGISLVVLFWSSASGGRADDAVVGELGPIRRWVAQNDSISAQIPLGPPKPVRVPLMGRNHADQGAIAGAVIGGVAGGLYLGAMGAFACEAHPDDCHQALFWAAAGGAGGALVGGAVGGLIGSLFQTAPSTGAAPSHARTTLTMVPSRRGVAVAVSHSF